MAAHELLCFETTRTFTRFHWINSRTQIGPDAAGDPTVALQHPPAEFWNRVQRRNVGWQPQIPGPEAIARKERPRTRSAVILTLIGVAE